MASSPLTTIPSTNSCDAGGDSWLMEVAAENGGEIDHPVFDLNGDGVFGYGDMVSGDDPATAFVPVSGKRSTVGILQPPAFVAGVGGQGDGNVGKAEATYAAGSANGQIEVTLEQSGLLSGGRKSWVQLR